MVRIVNSPLTSQPIAEKRSISTLGQVGADRDALQIIGRQDGIIANQPKDGFISADEINASLQSPHVDLLSSTEVNALRGAVSLLEVRMQTPTVAPFQPLPALSSFVATSSVEPVRYPVATFSTATPIDIKQGKSFGSSGVVEYLFRDHATLERLQRVANNDADPKTVSIDDMRSALITHGTSFTPQEVAGITASIDVAEKFLQGRADYANRNNKPETPNVGSRADVKSTSTSHQELARLGQVGVFFDSTMKSTVDNDVVTVSRTSTRSIVVPAGLMCVMHFGNSGDGQVQEERPKVLGPGRHEIDNRRFELQTWKDGAIQRTDKVDIDSSYAPTAWNPNSGNPANSSEDTHVVGGLRGYRIFLDGTEQPSTYNRIAPKPGVFEAGPFTVISQGKEGPLQLEVPGLGRFLMDNLDDGAIKQLGVAVDLPAHLRAQWYRVSDRCTAQVPQTGPVEIAYRGGEHLQVKTDSGWATIPLKQVGA